MDLIVWARENPVLVVTALAIAALIVVAMRMARVPDSAEEPHPTVAERPAVEKAVPPRVPFARSMPAPPQPVAVAQPAPQVAPAGYVPLEVPELWEPPVGYLGAAGAPSSAPSTPVHRAAATSPAGPGSPARYPARTAPFVQPVARAQAPSSTPLAPAAQSRPPRSFDDLRSGALAGRTFESLQQFAVAAVVEAGHPVVLVARIFRVPSWKLESWVEAAFHAAPVPVHRPWRGTMPRAV